jgi:hypothetical protein
VNVEPLPNSPVGPVVFPDLPQKLAPGPTGGEGAGTVGCATCGGIGQTLARDGEGFQSCSTCGGSGCVPGRKACYPYEGHSFLGRFCSELYASLCCPDPCYEPGWVAAANAAFFVDSARPRTVQRFRNDHGWDLLFPDRNEFFWARQPVSGGGSGPGTPKTFPSNKTYKGQPSVNYNEFTFYNEIAASTRSSLFVELAYRNVGGRSGDYFAGFSDMNIGTKGVIFDSELLLLTIQFRTYLPTGNASQGLGTGHISLEPSLLGSLKLSPNAYLQGQVSEWIPIGGDGTYAGSLIHYHGSYNQVLCRFAPDSPLIATFEGYGYTFQGGAYTNPSIASPYISNSTGTTYFNLGAGLRAVICNAVDFGGAISFPVTTSHFADPLLRLELRILY